MFRFKHLLLPLLVLYSGIVNAQITDIVGPTGSGDFGYSVTALSNGNYVITDPFISNGALGNAGAVYLYDGKTHSLISTLKGAKSDDFVGRDGVVALPNGNFVVLSRSVDNGFIVDCGAITWVNGSTGLSGEVTIANSLFGTATNDSLGSGDIYGVGGLVVLENGNYVMVSPGWDNGSVVNAGAVTLLDGNSATSGVISSGNSLVGSSTNDRVGSDGIFILENSHFIVRSFTWNNGTVVNAGAITWCNGISLAGQLSSANSLVGTTTDDFFDDIIPYEYKIRKLTNGNFVVINRNWDDVGSGVVNAGAITWGSNTLGISGVISSNNSLVGTKGDEQIGGGPGLELGGVVALSNGNYVVVSPYWHDEINYGAGAVTWGNGNTGVTGIIDSTNSLVGSSNPNQDEVGRGGVVALSNGNYVILSPYWNNDAGEYVGAITWGNGTTGTTGKVNPANSLVGTTGFDFDFGTRITPLSNGHYVVSTPKWDNGNLIDAGAVTWANGSTGITGEINSGTSLVGNTAKDELGQNVKALPNGNYIICSPNWDNGAVSNAGAATWANGNTGITGFVNSSNSLVGSQPDDNIGTGYYDVTVLTNGNFVISSPYWDNGTVVDAGAATWANGMIGVSGPVNGSNSLVGTATGARVSFSVNALTNGNYVVSSPLSNDVSQLFGAVTWGNGNSGVTGPVTSSNSLMGGPGLDHVGGVLTLQNGNYIVLSGELVGGPGTGKGSVTWGNGLTGISGIVSSDNSLVGTSPHDRVGEQFSLSNDHYVVMSPHYDNGSITDAGAVTFASNTSGITGVITNCNSISGETANNGWQLAISYSDVPPYLIVGRAVHNVVRILQPVSADLVINNDSASVNINGNTPVPLLTNDGCRLIATLTPQGLNPVHGILKAKTWNEVAVPVHNGEPFVSRHYEITPGLNASTATAKITLYFTQQEFDDFNEHAASTTNLPASADDTSGIAKLRIVKYPGISNDDSGLPGSYTGTPEVIDPVDQDVVWNNSLSRWEVSFDVTGFSGFIVQAANDPVTGTNDITNNSHLLHLFPNPARQNLSYELKSNTAGTYTIKIFDLNGRLMYSNEGRDIGNIIKGSIPIDFLSQGTYILEIATKKTTARKKLLKL